MADIRTIATALEARQTDMDEFPATRSIVELDKLLEPTYVKKLPRTDAFGHPFRYEAWQADPKSRGNDRYAVGSGGRDGKFNRRSLRLYNDGPTTNVDCDLVYSYGRWLAWPEGVQQQ